jgi:hypothetical protein
MKANELRINNYVVEGGDVTQVESIADDMINVFYHNVSGVTGCYIGDLVPVQLTEQWLKDFGIEIDRELPNLDYPVWPKPQLIVTLYQGQFYMSEDMDGYLFGPELKYVHQLQNLYFALTGKELTK